MNNRENLQYFIKHSLNRLQWAEENICMAKNMINQIVEEEKEKDEKSVRYFTCEMNKREFDDLKELFDQWVTFDKDFKFKEIKTCDYLKNIKGN